MFNKSRFLMLLLALSVYNFNSSAMQIDYLGSENQQIKKSSKRKNSKIGDMIRHCEETLNFINDYIQKYDKEHGKGRWAFNLAKKINCLGMEKSKVVDLFCTLINRGQNPKFYYNDADLYEYVEYILFPSEENGKNCDDEFKNEAIKMRKLLSSTKVDFDFISRLKELAKESTLKRSIKENEFKRLINDYEIINFIAYSFETEDWMTYAKSRKVIENISLSYNSGLLEKSSKHKKIKA